MGARLVELEDVTVRFDGDDNDPITALQDVNIHFNPGEWCYVVGSNGSGKSTLLKVLAKELNPSTGILKTSRSTFLNTCFIEQGVAKNLVPSMTVYENLALSIFTKQSAFSLLGQYRLRSCVKTIRKELSSFGIGLENRLATQINLLSGGQQQAVVAAKVILQSPKLILLDEFTSALDKRIAPIVVERLINYLTRTNSAVIAVTHDYNEVERYANRVLVLEQGKIVADLYKHNDDDLSSSALLKIVYGAN